MYLYNNILINVQIHVVIKSKTFLFDRIELLRVVYKIIVGLSVASLPKKGKLYILSLGKLRVINLSIKTAKSSFTS